MSTSKPLGYVAFAAMLLVGVFGGLFAAGYAFDDPGGWAAVGLVASYVVPVTALSLYAVVRPVPAGRLLAVVTGVLAVLVLLNAAFTLVDRDRVGPVDSLAVLVLGVALAFLGLHEPRLAGVLILAAGLAQVASLILRIAVVQAPGEGPPLGAALGGSSGVVVVPLLLIGALFVAAGGADRAPAPTAPARGPRGVPGGRPGP